MRNVEKDASLYLLTGLLQRLDGTSLTLVESMICDVKKDQISLAKDDPEKEFMDEIFVESLNLLDTVSLFLKSKKQKTLHLIS